MKVVVDSSVWIAGVGSSKGFASQTIYCCFNSGDIEVVISTQILVEVAKNLQKKLKFDPPIADQAQKIIRGLCDFELEISPQDQRAVRNIKYSPDKHILALCEKAEAKYLITFDRKHLLPLKKCGETIIVEPKDFIAMIK